MFDHVLAAELSYGCMWLRNQLFERKQPTITRTVRARRVSDGHFEFLEPVHIATKEFEITINERPETVTASTSYILPARDLGKVHGSLSREEIYDKLLG